MVLTLEDGRIASTIRWYVVEGSETREFPVFSPVWAVVINGGPSLLALSEDGEWVPTGGNGFRGMYYARTEQEAGEMLLEVTTQPKKKRQLLHYPLY
jgi:hypothetical protein